VTLRRSARIPRQQNEEQPVVWRWRRPRDVYERCSIVREAGEQRPDDGHERGLAIFDGQNALDAGWFELKLGGVTAERLLHPVLLVNHASNPGSVVEYILAPFQGGSRRVFFHAPKPVQKVRLVLSNEPAAADIRRVRLRRLSRSRVLLEAAQRAPREALTAGVWRLLGKKLRARNRLRRLLAQPPCLNYATWLARREPQWSAELPRLLEEVRQAAPQSGLSVLLLLRAGEPPSPDTLRSLQAQAYGAWQLVVVAANAAQLRDAVAKIAPEQCLILESAPGATRCEKLNAGLAAARGEWLLVLDNGDALVEGALTRIAHAAQRTPDAAIIYGDHDHVGGPRRRHQPHFKPQWNLPLFLAYDYITLAAFRRDCAQAVGGFRSGFEAAEIDDLLLRLVDAAGHAGVVHTARILHHRSVLHPHADETAPRPAGRLRAVADFLARRGDPATVAHNAFGHLRIVRAAPQPAPLVSLIVLTRDRVDLLRSCIEGLRTKTAYPALEIIIMDNDSRYAKTQSYLRGLQADPRVKVVAAPGSFNFSALNNAASRLAKGTVLGFINNDIDVIEPDWLNELISHAVRPEIGAVGARLLYGSGLVQHAGVILGLRGLAGHAHRFFEPDHLGYMHRLQTPQFLSAVTAACMVVERAKFEAVVGFDEDDFPVALNDVDLCLRLRERGWESFWTPYATLHHKESASRAHDLSRARRAAYERECENFRARWAHVIADDPYYNPNLTRDSEDFALA
jgi:GT2 family glycosyltransferase